MALGRYRDVEVETSSGEDSEGGYFTVRFTEPGEAGMVSLMSLSLQLSRCPPARAARPRMIA